MEEKVYTEKEVLEIIRQVLFYGEPEYWEKGGVTGCIPYPPGGTYKKAEHYFKKYFLKETIVE